MEAKTGIQNADAEKLYKKYWPMVLKRCRSMLGDAQSAKDAAQEVFVKILDKRNTLKVEYPSSFLWTMATRHCLNTLRGLSRRAEAADGHALLEKIAGSFDLEAQTANRDLIRKLFGGIPENSRAAAILHLVDGLTVKETARLMNITPAAVTKNLQALRQTLKNLENV